MPDQDFDRNRYRNRMEGDDMYDDPSDNDRMDDSGRFLPRIFGRRQGMRHDEQDMRDRGYYGRGSGAGESPYTSNRPSYSRRTGSGESPYTDYGRTADYMGRMNESPYTSNPPRMARRYGSGESPYTNYGPAVNRFRDMDYEEEQDYGPASFTYMEFWMVPGPETGRGPQGYRRSDERILDEINDRLMMHGRLDARDISLKVENGEVTLMGSVPSRRTRRMAEDVAESVMGVTDIHNELKVKSNEQRPEDRNPMV